MQTLIPITAESKAEDGMCFLLSLLLGGTPENPRAKTPPRASWLISLHYAKQTSRLLRCVRERGRVSTCEFARVWKGVVRKQRQIFKTHLQATDTFCLADTAAVAFLCAAQGWLSR